MATKNNPGKIDCYGAAMPDEPMFILLGRDCLAPAHVEAYASALLLAIRNGEKPASDMVKVEEAFYLAREMRKWRADNEGAWRTTPLLDYAENNPATKTPFVQLLGRFERPLGIVGKIGPITPPAALK